VTFLGLTIYDIYLKSVNCTKFDQLILRKIVKIVAIRCHTPNLILAGVFQDPAGPWLYLRGLLLRGGEGTEEDRIEGEGSKGEEGRKGKGRKVEFSTFQL